MGSEQLSEEDIHDVLSNRRRRLVLETLRNNGGQASARTLSEHIATVESGESPPPRNIRQSAYVSLHQTHLPKLNHLDIIDYDEQSKSVNLTENQREVAAYMESEPKYGISWGELSVGMGGLGVLTLLGALMELPFFRLVSPVYWAIGFLLLVCVSGVIQIYRQGSPIFSRLSN